MTTVAATRIKHDGEVFLPGDTLTGEFTKEQAQQLIEAGAVVSKERWDALHPEPEEGEEPPEPFFNTPSNLAQIAGTALAADPEKGGVGDVDEYNATKDDESEDDAAVRTLATPDPILDDDSNISE